MSKDKARVETKSMAVRDRCDTILELLSGAITTLEHIVGAQPEAQADNEKPFGILDEVNIKLSDLKWSATRVFDLANQVDIYL